MIDHRYDKIEDAEEDDDKKANALSIRISKFLHDTNWHEKGITGMIGQIPVQELFYSAWQKQTIASLKSSPNTLENKNAGASP